MLRHKKSAFRALLFGFLTLAYFLPLACLARLAPDFSMAPTVEAVTANVSLWQDTLPVTGNLSASQGITINSQISGPVTAIYFRSNEFVKKGTPLVQLNSQILKAQYVAAKINYQVALDTLRRALLLYKKKILAKADIQMAQGTFATQQAALVTAQENLKQTLITAPFTGHLGLRTVDLGEMVTPSTTLTTLNALNTLRVDFSVSEADSAKIHMGTSIVVHSPAFPNQVFQAKIYAIDSQLDTATRSLGVRAALPNPEGKLLPGSYVDVDVPLAKAQFLITLPDVALNTDEKGSYIFKIINNTATKTYITLLKQRAGEIAVTGDINQGDSVISAGSFKVTDKQPISIAK